MGIVNAAKIGIFSAGQQAGSIAARLSITTRPVVHQVIRPFVGRLHCGRRERISLDRHGRGHPGLRGPTPLRHPRSRADNADWDRSSGPSWAGSIAATATRAASSASSWSSGPSWAGSIAAHCLPLSCRYMESSSGPSRLHCGMTMSWTGVLRRMRSSGPSWAGSIAARPAPSGPRTGRGLRRMRFFVYCQTTSD
jgi:hypothetical protein